MEYQIAAQTVSREPTVGKFYLDADDDLFLYMGDTDWEDTWLQFTDTGAYDRDCSYPKEPLTEVTRSDYVPVIDRHLRKDYI